MLTHAGVALGVAATVTAARRALLATSNEFREATNRSNAQVLRPLSSGDVVTVSLLPAVAEETVFRGVLIPAFSSVSSTYGAVVISGLVFGALHVGGGRNAAFAAWASLVGVLYGAAAVATGDVATAMLAHGIANYASASLWLKEDAEGKNLFMEGICIQGGVKNANERVYPVNEISKAVETLNEQIKDGSVLGEVDHPDDLKINLDRVCHTIEKMWMDGPNGYGKLKILPTPMGELVKTMLQNGVKLGVSSRGSGNVDPTNGHVSDFEIVTVDVVAQPSAPNAYPKAIYEGLMNMKYGHNVLEMAREAGTDDKVQRYLKDEVTRLIKDLKI